MASNDSCRMPQPAARAVRRDGIRLLVLGAVSVSAYVLVFWQQERVLAWTTRGGWWAPLPIAVAIFFAFVHGAFASALLHVLGVRPGAHTTHLEIP